jgi:Resolvase, N terminal domain/Recombinase
MAAKDRLDRTRARDQSYTQIICVSWTSVRSAVAYLVSPASDTAGSGLIYPHDIRVTAVVVEEHGAGRARLGDALESIASGHATVLAVASLGTVAGSLGELVALLDWLAAAGADLLVLDVGLDGGSGEGARTIELLREIARLEREPAPGRTPRGRPGLALRAPELSERIAMMRELGLSLQAIADTLNDERVPTQRGGARWRPSSVQSALGYRRPRPHPHGAPPPPPHRHPRGPPPPPGGGRGEEPRPRRGTGRGR